MSASRVSYCYELMDAACDAAKSHQVAIIYPNPRRNAALREHLRLEALALRLTGHVDPSKERFKQHSSVERVNAALKDSYGGRHLRVRGAAKVACHLFFSIFALTVDQ